MDNRPQRIFIAIQGGAAQGAYAWGMLDALLAKNLDIVGVSGTSSGATTAAFLVDGLLKGGRACAIERISDAWTHFSAYAHTLNWESLPDGKSPVGGFLAEMDKRSCGIDYKRLRASREPLLLVNATRAPPGRAWEADPQQHERVFTNAEITKDVIVASGALANVMAPVMVNGEPLLDGAYCANPHLSRAVEICFEQEAMLVVLRTRPTKSFRLNGYVPGTANWNRAFFNSLLDEELDKIVAKNPQLPIRVIQPSGVDVLGDNPASDPDFNFERRNLRARHNEGFLAAQRALHHDYFMPRPSAPSQTNYFIYTAPALAS